LWLGDHRIDEECILPGAAYAEIALAAVRDAWGEIDLHSWTIRELLLHHLMVVTDETEVVTTLAGDKSQARVEIRSRRGDSEWVINAVANVGCVSSPVDRAALDMDGAPLAEVGPDDLYGRLRGVGLQYGPAFQGVVGLALCDSGVARARVRLPSAARRDSRRFLLHPVMVDIALQVLGATKGATDLFAGNVEGHALVLPVRFGGVRVFGDVTKAAYAVGSLQPIERSGREVGRVVVTDADGQALLAIDEVEMEVLPASGHADELTRRMFVLEWVPSDLGKAVPDIGGGVLVVAEAPESDELLNAVTSSLAGRTESLQYVSPTDERELHAALTRSDISWDEILVVLPTGADDESQPDQRQLDDVQKRTLLIAEIVKTVSKVGSRNSPRLLIVTRGAQQLDSADPVTLAQTGVRGLARVLTFEHPELKATIVDVDPAGAASADALVAEVLADADADEVALRDGQRYVHRLVAAPTTPTGQVAAEVRYTDVDVDVDGPAGFRLQLDHAGRLDGLSVHAIPRRAPQPGEVEVRVNVAALNFSDVLKTMGLYPGLNGQAPVIGGEGVGVVTAVGEGVDSVRTGQRVLIVGPGTFGSHVTTMEDLVVPIPDALSDHEAATFGVAYLTAWYSLREVGRLAAGERVLIHSATGGVGLAAIAVAKMVGARIYATAGSDSKRRLLTTLGVDYVGDSRNVAFAEEILELTNRAGVDVVLNSLAGEAINRGVEILAPGGRFVELGKKDVYADAQLGLAALAKSASFSVVDLDLNLRLQPQRYRRMLCDILTLAADRELNPLPRTEFTFDRVIDAFRLMASGGHTGKILVSMPTEGTVRAVAAPPQPPVARDGGYIVVGGMGGVGFVAARWLAEQGAGIVVLNGRSAPDTDTARAIADLNANGKRVEVLVGDIAAEETAGRLVAAVENAGFRVRGVLHSAMVLDDQIVLNMSESAVARVLRAKVTGSWRLHEATAHKDLDWWLAFSSAASLLGSPGQGAYAAANSWLDGLVAYRRSRGLPAVGINWGPWAEVGRAQSFANLGFSMVTPEQGLAAIERLLAADRSSTGVFGIDARQWFQSFPAAAQSSLFAELSDSATFGHRGDGKVAAELAAMAPSERRTRLASTIADAIRAVVRSSEPIDHHDAMNSLGLDSLMTLELRNRLESSVGITLPATLVWSHPTISDLADTLCERLGYEPECGDGVRDRAHQRAAARQGAALRRKRGQHL
jgi:phthiocerol/phenolphthiocerol synthesis type-I polyketide synthase C